MPAFSVDTVSVGFGVHQCSFIERSKWGSDLPRHRSRRHFRFVRDDASGLLIHVYDSPEDGLIKIDYMALQTARRRRRVYVSIRRADVLEMACSSSFSIDGLMRAAVVVQSIDELRRCPLCRGAANGSCECRYVITPPKHPLDFYSMHNFGVHHGFFLGSVSSVLFKDGADVMTAQLSSALDVECSTDFDLIQQLSRWAISDKLKDVTIDPLSVMMSVGDNADFYEGNNKKSNQTGNTDSYSVNTSAYDGSIALEMVVDEAIREPAVIQEVIPEDGECSSIDLLTNGDAQTEMDKFANSVKHDEKAEQGDEDKEQRAALRRQRNREAATRSNMKRKLKNDRLKSDLQESRGRAAELRARELVLREENIRLRRMLTR